MNRSKEDIIAYLKSDQLEECIAKEKDLIEEYGKEKYESVLKERMEMIKESYKLVSDNPDIHMEEVIVYHNDKLKEKWLDFKLSDSAYIDNVLLNIIAGLKIRELM